jgi:hypothetical protein
VQHQVLFDEAPQFVDVLGREALLSPGDGVDVARTAGGVVEGLGDFLSETPQASFEPGRVVLVEAAATRSPRSTASC